MLNRSFAPGFRLDLFHKDMSIIQAAARDKGVTTLLGSLVAQVISSLVAPRRRRARSLGNDQGRR
jgi:2-hydroxy-3-oxopropionate reductase